VAATAATILITWDLWKERAFPPMLPALPVPPAGVGWALLGALGSSLIWPRTGVSMLAVLLVYAVVRDQTRLQPEMISLTILMLGTLVGGSGRLIARAHLVSLWGWAGLNKLLSPTFLASAGPLIVISVWPSAPRSLAVACGWTLALSELSIAVFAAIPRTRRLAAWLAVGLHTGILMVLVSSGASNVAVLPWNVALVIAALTLIRPWKEPLPRTFRASPLNARMIAAALVVAPAGFYLGIVDAYLAHNLYSANTSIASIGPPTMRLLRVPFPPERRLYIQYFQSTCYEGQQLHVVDRRRRFSRVDEAPIRIPCEFHVTVKPDRP
jgi:hypothetical protein